MDFRFCFAAEPTSRCAVLAMNIVKIEPEDDETNYKNTGGA